MVDPNAAVPCPPLVFLFKRYHKEIVQKADIAPRLLLFSSLSLSPFLARPSEVLPDSKF